MGNLVLVLCWSNIKHSYIFTILYVLSINMCIYKISDINTCFFLYNIKKYQFTTLLLSYYYYSLYLCMYPPGDPAQVSLDKTIVMSLSVWPSSPILSLSRDLLLIRPGDCWWLMAGFQGVGWSWSPSKIIIIMGWLFWLKVWTLTTTHLDWKQANGLQDKVRM